MATVDRPRLCGQDREVLTVWREHGIPLDRTTVDHARHILDTLAAELDEVWVLINELLDGRPLVCAACAAEIQPSLPLEGRP